MTQTAGVDGVVVPVRADEVLRRFVAARLADASGAAAARLRAAEAALRECFDALAPRLLDPSELALLALERQFAPSADAARVASADALLLLLPLFLDDPRWHGRAMADRRLRVRLARPLADEVAQDPTLRGRDLSRLVWIVEAAVRHETWMLRQEQAALRAG